MTDVLIAIGGAVTLIAGSCAVLLGVLSILLRNIGKPRKVANTSWNVNNWS